MTTAAGHSVAGRVALLTGAARGIGRAAALMLASAGAAVAVHYRSAEAAANATVNAIAENGGRAMAVQADITSEADVTAMVARTERQLGPIDILVNNAGTHAAGAMLDTAEEEFDRLIAVNVTGAFLCARAVVPGMIARRHGRIISVSSDCAKRGGKVSGVHFSASKAALLGLTRSLARQLAPHGVTANDVSPAMILTERWSETLDGAEIAARAARMPVGRLGQAQDVAAAILFLAGDRSDYVTGVSLDVAGGLLIG